MVRRHSKLGIQMSPILGTLRCLSANKGVTLRKVGGVVELRLQPWGWSPSPCFISHLQPNLSASIKTTMSYFDYYVSNSGFIWSIPTSVTTPKPKKRSTTAPFYGPFCPVRKSNLLTICCSRTSCVNSSTPASSALDEDMIFQLSLYPYIHNLYWS
jgi:hypothetical protein